MWNLLCQKSFLANCQLQIAHCQLSIAISHSIILWGTKKLTMMMAIRNAVIAFSYLSKWILKKFMFVLLVCFAESYRTG